MHSKELKDMSVQELAYRKQKLQRELGELTEKCKAIDAELAKRAVTGEESAAMPSRPTTPTATDEAPLA